MSEIVITDNPESNVAAWVVEKSHMYDKSEIMFRQAIQTGQDLHKLAYFDAVKRIREIEAAIEQYWLKLGV